MSKKYLVRPETAVLTRGYDPRLSVGAARPAVFRSSTYVFRSPESAAHAFEVALGRARPAPGESVDLIYARLSHPNAEILEDQIVPLERAATSAAVFNSGMAAITSCLLSFCPPGSTLIHTAPLYGGTQLFLDSMLQPLGVSVVAVDAGDTVALTSAIAKTKGLKLIFMETPANPTLRMSDIVAAVHAARKRDDRPLVVVDNTFLGPSFQHPLALGADLVVYSATKYLAGFSDLLAGVVLAKDDSLTSHLRSTRALLGNILQADECWLLNTRLVTVPLRMNRQSKNAQHIAEALAHHPAVERIHYPSLFTDPEQRRIRDAQTDYPGAVITLELKRGRAAAFTFLRSIQLTHNAVSLGGVESLACHPRTTTHSELGIEQLERAGITEGMVRLSIGVENWHDLLNDYQAALDGL
jgi:cystathionine beta-lyase/cystathionine gamma-synthase